MLSAQIHGSLICVVVALNPVLKPKLQFKLNDTRLATNEPTWAKAERELHDWASSGHAGLPQ